MREIGVEFDRSGATPRAVFPASFNAATPFIDRHTAAGRGAKAAIVTSAGETVTYAQLAQRVDRAGNALLALGIRPGDRLLMVVKDCPAFFYAFWGAIKAGIVPAPVNTLLRAPDYAYMVDDSACAAVLYSAEFAAEVEPALALASSKPVALRADADDGGLLDRMALSGARLEARPATAEDDCFW
ncbi:MAG: AMP-binding protein, partial [Rhodospirillales bacterium]|nr:AMP-binding protein [Rhodospirillales bacterium]